MDEICLVKMDKAFEKIDKKFLLSSKCDSFEKV